MVTGNRVEVDISFDQLYHGRLVGVLDAGGYDLLADSLVGQWWAISFDDKKQAEPVSLDGGEVGHKLKDLGAEIKKLNLMSAKYPYTYVASLEGEPAMIKLYHPLKTGGCGSSAAPLPWWIFSTLQPDQEKLAELAQK